MAEGKRFLIFSLEGENYAIPIAGLLEITVARNIQKDPNLPGFAGKFEFRGSWVPVLDIYKFFNLSSLPGTALLVIQNKNGLLGIQVDAVTDILDTGQSLTPMPDDLVDPDLRCYNGILRYKETLVLLLNADGLLP
jgi:chemotaxis signal transduction protein